MILKFFRHSFRKIAVFLRTGAGRLLMASVGLGAVIVLFSRVGSHAILATLGRAAPFFPCVLFLEAGILACSMRGLYLLYGEDRKRLPPGAVFRAGLIGYAVMGLLPAGRAVAEATRAAMLSRYSGSPRAAAAAVRMQSIVLLGNSVVSVPAGLAIWAVSGFSRAFALISLNFVITLVLGLVVLLGGKHSKMGERLGKRLPDFREKGSSFDRYLSEKGFFRRALGWECAGRALQVFQNAILVLAVGGRFGITQALCSEAVHLVGAAGGDLIPAQLGTTELSYHFLGGLLALRPADAVAIAVLAHLAQLSWMGVGSVLPLYRRLDQEDLHPLAVGADQRQAE